MIGVSVADAARRARDRVDRKTSLKLLAGALAATAFARTTPETAAGKTGAKGLKRCRAQRGQCRAFVQNDLCASRETASRLIALPGDCVEQKSLCCDAFATCDLGKGLRCLMQRSPTGPVEK
ncbi:MAG: hypothetical protein IT338_16865 [Thermomicrobiales bacterium]|nr:hypothetical protein [Thermomicrobiales bacterium]